ncbi:MAG: ATP-dependent helicase HrpB [Pseudomonadota bacterium]
MDLPIDPLLPEICATLARAGRLVLEAPPGAGKTTRVPLALLQAGATGRIIMLEPRRLAARAAAERMAQTLGEPVGQTVGYRVRGDSATSKATQIEVVTEGILTRMLQDAPDLPGVATVIFDEFHERSLNADLGLALCAEVAGALRDDLRLVVMSATLDAAPVAEMLSAPRLRAEGRSFDVTPHWLERPLGKARFEDAVAALTRQALREQDGSALVFLPGEREIRRVEALLRDLPYPVLPLYGALDPAAQRKAVTATGKRRIVLATSIAETSLTLPDIRIVIDGGRSRRALFDPASGMSRLVTERVTRAEATQRAGRAGRVAAGHGYKLWTRGEDGALAAFPPPEVEAGDLAGLALELALWGAAAEELAFVTPPHAARLAEAQALLSMLGALNGAGRITPHGRALAALPLHPRLAHMLRRGGSGGARLAALLAERDVLRGVGVDLRLRLEALRDPGRFGGAVHRGALERVRQEAKRLTRHEGRGLNSLGALAALAYPDRVGLRRAGDAPRYVLSGGKGAVMPEGDALAGARLIVATDLDGNPREARVRQAAELSESDLRALFSDQIGWANVCTWSRREGRVQARQQERFGALILADRAWKHAPADVVARAMLDGVRQLGLLPDARAARLLARIRLMHDGWDDAALLEAAEDWLLPFLTNVRSAADWKAFDLTPALEARLGWDGMQVLDREAPGTFTTPLGRKVAIDYAGEVPKIAVRLQEMFGVTRHPQAAGAPLKITLLSPAQRPIQITMDLPGFWSGSYAEVRKDMRAQYPKHPWPEDPTEADPTLRAKRRGTPNP